LRHVLHHAASLHLTHFFVGDPAMGVRIIKQFLQLGVGERFGVWVAWEVANSDQRAT
jgi:hypothetical protein